jgi:hypothetical protein
MRITVLLLMFALILLPAMSDARCRTVGESASLGSEYGMFPRYPAERMVQAGEKHDNPALMWAGYAVGVPLFVVGMATGIVGTAAGALSHPWTKCIEIEEQRMPEIQPVRALASSEQ